MRRSHVFEAALVLIAIGLAGLLCYIVLSEPPAGKGGWEMSANGSVDYMFAGSGDTLYTFAENHLIMDGANRISAFGQDGSLRWSFGFPPEWHVLNDWEMPLYSSRENVYGYGTPDMMYRSYPIVAENNGSLYVYVSRVPTEENMAAGYYDEPFKVMKIAADGSVAWEHAFEANVSVLSGWLSDIPAIRYSNGRIYLFIDYTQYVMDDSGRLLFSIDNVSRPATIDESGHIYTVRARNSGMSMGNAAHEWDLLSENEVLVGLSLDRMVRDPTYLVPTSIVDAYDADGRLIWSRDIGQTAVRAYVAEDEWARFGSMPLYVNGTLYVPVRNGVVTLDTSGNVLWSHQIFGGLYLLFDRMPMDSQGNVYMSKYDPEQNPVYLVTIGPDGREYSDALAYQQQIKDWSGAGYYFTNELDEANNINSEPIRQYYQGMYSGPRLLAGNEGIVYACQSYNVIDNDTMGKILSTRQFNEDTITAYDVKTAVPCWNFTVPDADRHVTMLNASNYPDLLRITSSYSTYATASGPHVQKNIMISPGSDVLYIYYDYVLYDGYITDSGSPCLYVNSIYALDNDGNPLWSKPVAGHVTNMATGNGTIYYSTDNGRIGGNQLNIAAGVAIIALACMFLRFFMIGTVARARGRLNKNENRNAVLRYIADNPGATATDMAKNLGVNMGTIRYHLFILAMNHKVVTYKAGNKYLRYFTNAGTYSKEDQSLLSLMRREPLRKTLYAIAEKPGLSGPELAGVLDVSTTAAHRDLALLARRGIIEQVPGSDRLYGYAIKDEHRERIDRAMELLRQRA